MLTQLGGSVIPASFCRLVRVDESRIDPRYAYYALQEMYASGRAGDYEHRSTGISNFQFEFFLDQELVALPSLPEQHEIAGVLGALDDKIELNRQMSQTLDSMARALFKSWFVDFDPVRAKAGGRHSSLSRRLVEAFPNAFDESETGEIPHEWRVAGLDEIATFLNGLALQRFPAGEGPVLPVIKISQLHAGNTEGADRASADIPGEYVVQDGDVLFSWSGSLAVEVWSGGPGALNQHLFKVTSTRWPKWFYYLWTCQHLGDFSDIAAGKATTMGHIQRHHLSDAKVVVPSLDVMEAADTVFGPITEASWRIRVQSRSLAGIRGSLLPALLGGEIGARLGGGRLDGDRIRCLT
jgi:type I restriction enzyme S subunit